MTNATIQEIEGIDDYWGPAFRSVYEGEGHEAFVQQLDERIKQHDKEIEKLCNFHYQGFIDSIRELLKVRSHAEELHAEISNVDANVKEATESICTRADELIRARRVELNIAATIEKMELCLPLLTTYSKLKTQVEAKRYYPALKTLEQLEHVLLPRVGPYKWCGQIAADIPRLRQAIQDASMADLRDFLEEIRRLSPQVGAMALRQTQEILGRSLASIVKNKKDMAVLGISGKEAIGPQCPHELVDFSPLHRCLHIHSVLGAKNDFIQYYRAQRKQQARLVLIPAGNLHDNIQSVKNYLNAVLGFFILEEYLLSAGAGLVSKDWLLDTWGMAVSKVAATLRTNTSLITDPTLMLSIKHQIVLFINTLKCYGLPTDQLPLLLQEMAEHYTEVLMQRWVVVFRDILDNAAFTPIEVETQEQYDGVMDTFPYEGEELETQPFPRKFPFSSIVPAVYVQVKEFIYAWLKYSAGLGLGGSRRAAAARHSASLLLSRSFTGCLSALFRRPLPLMQLVQIIVDTKYLEDATLCLYEFISNITGSELVTTQTAGSMFQAARDDAEQQICDKLEKKVDEFLDLENYDWLLVEPTGQASAFVTDMLSYLSGVLTSLEQLPERARVAAVRAATNRIATRLRNLLLEPGVRQVSSGALHQLDLDVIQCEQFAAGEPVPGLRDQELLEHFASLRQLLDLVNGWDWSSYLHDVGIDGGKYHLVTPRDAATLLEKLKEAEQKSSVFTVLKKNERDRRKLLDTVLKQLKQLQNQDGS
ncbi:exocyst complex component 6 isoform X2 [Ostrinia furnacalis]|uniref:exocyst complex component 6 isoform X1 n=2 Tax=Ostrinia furnacalis TaxID=93504 RepID=UPI00103AF1EE|nr:exocyst complex component 6 isoform X1 [Ostrinia furnacalis]XP_028166671.1 exocyst complex component 6 isoform X2 [Ostrinia furnacalis]